AGIESDVTPQFAGQNLPEWDLNYEIIEVDPEELGNDTVFATPGSTATVTGALGYAYRDYQIWAETVELNVTDFAVRPVRAAEADEFTIATQNIENFFDLVDDPDRDDATFEDYVPATEEVYALRLQKVSAQIREVLNAPDIVALQEIENENTLNDLISQIQSDDPAIVYEGCIFEGNDGRGIDNGYLVRQGRVEILDCYRMPGSLTEPGVFGGTLYGRPPLVLDAALIQDDMLLPITVINLHIKSLSGIEQNVTQQRRLAQAQGIAAYVQERLTENPDVQLIVAGDLNAFPFSDGLVNVAGVISGEYEVGDALVSPEAAPVGDPILINQVMRVPEADRYSYIFNSTSQVLDHILTTANLDALITDVQFSRGNADALYTFAESDASAMRSSDHDGFVIYLRFSE
ncbi:MAG: endonuclease/exonuclease/phosphatase family protein, partial [Aggregatilineales bacterium]